MSSDLIHRVLGEDLPQPESRHKPSEIVKIVVPTVVIGVAILAVAACCVIRARKRRSVGEPYFFKGFLNVQGGKA